MLRNIFIFCGKENIYVVFNFQVILFRIMILIKFLEKLSYVFFFLGQDFEKYILEVLYFNLVGKKFDIYKIDKQWWLIWLVKYILWVIKDFKY